METLITICARGGSKGLKNKNIKNINGRPLIYYTLRQAKNISKIIKSDIEISTDSSLIKDICAK